MHYIKDIFNKVESVHSHNKFIRYSKGNFIGPLMIARFSKKEMKVRASFHYNDELLLILAEKIGNEKVLVKGSLVWNSDLSEKLSEVGIEYLKVRKSRGIFKYELDNEVLLKNFIEKMINYNLIISFKLENGISLTTKPTFPKPNKPFGADFCKLVIPTENFKDIILSEFVFDLKNKDKLKVIEIKHSFEISNIEIPNIEDFTKARKLAKRQGTIKREVIINKEEPILSSIEFKI